ncbi:hypothetical protein GSI_12284 [Ganoderma sinense ZZ0214-1]|uniref:F-box domain-containing protein n=1 Tax=Ganoderma sinense ZZ0214-1 TaxID=1077348 RepID=A0A2G8RYD2_9APHY|nr:hypothetical protein GSI_12284 [Ganoderma sinense ZZ0214-1]
MSPPTPLWRLLAPTGSTFKETSEFFDRILSEKSYADPIRWARFMWYARFVQELHIIAFGTEDKHKQIIYALVEHNGGESIFPALQTLWWSPSSYSDTSYFPLFTPQLRSAILNFSYSSEAGIQDPLDRGFLAQLHVSSPRLDYLCVDVSWGPLGVDQLTVIPSFEHLTDLALLATTSLTWLLKFATMPRMKCVRVAYVKSSKAELSRPPTQAHAPHLTAISVGGNCNDQLKMEHAGIAPRTTVGLSVPLSQPITSALNLNHTGGLGPSWVSRNCPTLARLFTALDAPRLASASFHAMSNDRHDADYISCIEALATACPPSAMEALCIALDEDGGPQMLEYLTDLLDPLLPFHNITHFRLSCLMVALVADDDDLWAIARAWPKLQKFELWQAHWDNHADPDEDSDSDEDEDRDGLGIPTPVALASFRDHCPDLRELVLPHLDFDADMPTPQRMRPWGREPQHGLKILGFGAKDLGGDDGDFRVQGRASKPDDRQVAGWARYVLDLFPKLDAEKSLSRCGSFSTEKGWREVLKRARDLRKSGVA